MVVWKKSVALAIDLVVNEVEVSLFLHLARQSGLELGSFREDLAEAVAEGGVGLGHLDRSERANAFSEGYLLLR